MLSLKENNKLAIDHFDLLKSSIMKRIESILKKEYFYYDTIKVNLLPQEITLIKKYYNEQFLKNLITSTPLQLIKIVRVLKLFRKDFQDKNSNIYKFFERVFFKYGYEKINNLKFINNIGVDTCPYCNRNYIYSLDEVGKIKPEIDHFYSKSIYPVLAACYYNLIPCCQTCNGFGGKGKIDSYEENLTNPYLIQKNDFKFTYKLKSLSRINPISGKSNITVIFDKRLAPHLKVFKLDKLYELHSDHVLELIVKSKLKYSSKYRQYLNLYKGLQFSPTEIDRLILGNYSKENELHKRPLSILYRDIGKQLGLIL